MYLIPLLKIKGRKDLCHSVDPSPDEVFVKTQIGVENGPNGNTKNVPKTWSPSHRTNKSYLGVIYFECFDETFVKSCTRFIT